MRVSKLFNRSKLDMDRAKRIIDFAAQNGVYAISFTGGEPLLFFDEIVVLLKYAKDAGIGYTRTGTNGFLFIEFRKYYRFIIDLGFTMVNACYPILKR